MEYAVDITIRTRDPLTERALFDIAAIGGVSVGYEGGREVSTTFTVDAGDMPAAAEAAIDRMAECVKGSVVNLEVMTIEEQDRRLEEPEPQLAGIAELAELLEVSKQRVTQLRARDDFPLPIQELAAGPVWRLADLSTFQEGWQRKPGRPWPESRKKA